MRKAIVCFLLASLICFASCSDTKVVTKTIPVSVKISPLESTLPDVVIKNIIKNNGKVDFSDKNLPKTMGVKAVLFHDDEDVTTIAEIPTKLYMSHLINISEGESYSISNRSANLSVKWIFDKDDYNEGLESGFIIGYVLDPPRWKFCS